ncbi:MAG: hypothetical protein GC137_02750 [Alphaproteobacteria bacterium]|nr:hypothetical protein [Alphaproteobacteria bacterium]
MTSHAYEDVDISAEEKAVFSYFRAIGKAPDYNFWITTGYLLDNVSYDKQEEYVLNETLRLGNGFSQHNQNEHLMAVRFDVIARYISAKEGSQPRMTFRVFNAEESYIPTFNFEYGKDVISLVVENLALFSDIPLADAQNEAVTKKLPVQDEDFKATIELKVRASNKTTDKPLERGTNTTWLMVGDIAHLKCVFTNNQSQEVTLWDYVAPWYQEHHRLSQLSEEQKSPHPYDLLDLKK